MLSGLDHYFVIAKYILIIMAAIGGVVLMVGLYNKQQKIIMRGAYILILSLVLGVCGYFIYETTVDKAQQMIYDTYLEYGN